MKLNSCCDGSQIFNYSAGELRKKSVNLSARRDAQKLSTGRQKKKKMDLK